MIDWNPVDIVHKLIQASDENGLRARWEFGHVLLSLRDGRGRLPNGLMQEAVARYSVSERELQYRMKFAERFPTELELRNALRDSPSWRDIVHDVLPAPYEKPAQLPMPTGGYLTVVVDPPWDYSMDRRRTFTERGGETLRLPDPYPSMTVAEIAALELPAAELAHVYLWTTRRYLRDAFDVFAAWDVDYSGALVWTKAARGFMLGGAFGSTCEFVLVGRRGELPWASTVNRSHFDWPRPGNKHSAKPQGFYELVEEMSHGPRLDMFARRERAGWDVWGDEAKVAA